MYSRQHHVPRPAKQHMKAHYSADVIVEIEGCNGNCIPMHALLDTGTSATIILREFVTQGKAKAYKSNTTTQWKTLGGTFNMN